MTRHSRKVGANAPLSLWQWKEIQKNVVEEKVYLTKTHYIAQKFSL